MRGNTDVNRSMGRFIGVAVVAFGLITLVLVGASILGYVMHGVGNNEVAVQFRQNVITNVVGPGVYTDIDPFADIQNVKIEGVGWCAIDPEVLTKDQQRIGVQVCGTAHRPGLDKENTIRTFWSQYRTLYTNDLALIGKTRTENNNLIVEIPGLMQNLAQQAMKVCVGDRLFSEAVVGSARDVLRNCVDEEISKLAINYGGIEVKNVVVPNIVMGAQVQQLLDAITKARFETDLAKQNELKAVAEALRTLAEQQGTIKVEQGKIQERQRQDAITNELERQATLAKQALIEAQKANELLSARKDLEIADAKLKVAQTNALAALADKNALAVMLGQNPVYAKYLVDIAMAEAWKVTDKIILPAGTSPITVISPTGSTPPVVVPVK